MQASKNALPKNVDEYIKAFPPVIGNKLKELRQTIKAEAPKAEELISYAMPGYKYLGMLVYFAGYKNHIGFYPGTGGIETFKRELSVYKSAKGSVQFPIDRPLPLTLIKKIIKFRVKQNEEKAAAKKGSKPAIKNTGSKKPSDEEQVKAYLDKLGSIAKAEIEVVRKIIKSASSKLAERIKWNAPSYYYKEDIVTFGPFKTHKLMLVFHHPAVVKVKSPLLEGDYKGRRLVHFKDKADAEKNKKELARVINEIIRSIDKK